MKSPERNEGAADRQTYEGQQSAAAYGWHGRITLTPSLALTKGCPVKLGSSDKSEVFSWIEKLIDFGHKSGTHYAPSALRYFARDFFDCDSRDYYEICKHIFLFSSSNKQDDSDIELDDSEIEEELPAPPVKKAIVIKRKLPQASELSDLVKAAHTTDDSQLIQLP